MSNKGEVMKYLLKNGMVFVNNEFQQKVTNIIKYRTK